MRDLVETAISQVMQQAPRFNPQGEAARKQVPHRGESVHALTPATDTQAPVKGKRDEELWQASIKFEALFMQQMMTQMRKGVPESGFLPHGFAEKSYESMMDQAMADAGSEQGSLGIATAIYRQLKHDNTTADGSVQAVAKASDRLKTLAADRYRSLASVVSKGDQ